MPQEKNIWYIGAHFMANIQARDNSSAQRQLVEMMEAIAKETHGRFSYLKLRTLQILTNANRAAFSVGASTQELAIHSREIVAAIDRIIDERQLMPFAQKSVTKTISLIPKADAYQDRKVQGAILYIKEHYTQPIARWHLAAHLECSPAHFSRLFSKTVGCSYKDYLLRVRLEKAKEFLQHSQLPVGEVARAIGYEDPFQFSKVFHRKVGISPRQFRKSRIGAGLPCGVQSPAMEKHQTPFL